MKRTLLALHLLVVLAVLLLPVGCGGPSYGEILDRRYTPARTQIVMIHGSGNTLIPGGSGLPRMQGDPMTPEQQLFDDIRTNQEDDL